MADLNVRQKEELELAIIDKTGMSREVAALLVVAVAPVVAEWLTLAPRRKKGWPDGLGLSGEASRIIAEHGGYVHLRLTDPDGRSARGACDDNYLGEWWTGLTSQVTCPSCLKVMEA